MKLKHVLIQFFNKYLSQLKGVSKNTIKSYRDTFSLLLPFAAQNYSIKIDSLNIDHLTPELIVKFLNHLEIDRNNSVQTRNYRLAALKSLAKMLLLSYPQYAEIKMIAERILNIPKKRSPKPLIEYLTQEEILKVFNTINLKKKDGFRDYAMLNLLIDSGARASEIAMLKLDYFDKQNKILKIYGKGMRLRCIELSFKTIELISEYINNYRQIPKPQYGEILFINQRGEQFTRYGINRICKKYLQHVLSEKRMKCINPVHCFRHACAINMLCAGKDITEIKNRLGHERVETTMLYLKLNISKKRHIQKEFIEYTESSIKNDPKIDEIIDWENQKETLSWLDSM